MRGDDWRAWYEALDKPSWTPSPGTIGTIWTILYPVILIVDLFVLVQAARGRLPWSVVLPFALNLAANVAFTPILFGLQNLTLATLDILLVLATIVWAMAAVWPYYPLASVAFAPYLAWVATATVLQLELRRRNGGL